MHLRFTLLRLALAALAISLTSVSARADEGAEVRALAARGELDAALQRVEKAVAANPRDAQLRFLQGVVLMDMQKDQAALEVFSQLSQEYPELPDPYNNIALLQVRAGRLELARQALEIALRNNPGFRTARANLGLVYLMLAVQAWEQAAAGTNVDPVLQRRLEAARALLVPGTGR